MSARVYRVDILASLLAPSDTPPSGQYAIITSEKLRLEGGRDHEVYRLATVLEKSVYAPLGQFWLEKFPYFNPVLSGYDLIRAPETCSGFLLRLKDPANIARLEDYAADIECALIPA